MKPLFARLSAETAATYDLVMKSAGIPCRVVPQSGRYVIMVATDLRQSAIEAVSLYLGENPPRISAEPSRRFQGAKTYSALFIVPILVVIHWCIKPGYEHQVFVENFGADAQRIMAGELYRCATALLLHADWSHLLNNVVGGILFGTVAASLGGWGVGWLMILLSGVTGNYLTALWYRHGHLSIGASTAVFGALGVCVALNLWRVARDKVSPWRMWLPLAGGLALLGFLGGSARSDVMAHLLGFACGLVIGGAYGLFRKRPWGAGIQLAAAVTGVVLILLGLAWGVRAAGWKLEWFA